MEEKAEPYKVELINDLPADAHISFYKQGEFTDCLLYTSVEVFCRQGDVARLRHLFEDPVQLQLHRHGPFLQ